MLNLSQLRINSINVAMPLRLRHSKHTRTGRKSLPLLLLLLHLSQDPPQIIFRPTIIRHSLPGKYSPHIRIGDPVISQRICEVDIAAADRRTAELADGRAIDELTGAVLGSLLF